MKKVLITLGVVLVLLLGGGWGYLAYYDATQVIPAAEKALEAYQARGLPEVYDTLKRPVAWIEVVRTEDGDAGPALRKTFEAFPANFSVDGLSLSDKPDDVAAMVALLSSDHTRQTEAAARHKTCLLTGGAYPFADDPFQTEFIPVLKAINLGRLIIIKGKKAPDPGAAETQFMLALSLGDHIESDYSMLSHVAGLAISHGALEQLVKLYQTEGNDERFAQAQAFLDSNEKRRILVKQTARNLYEISLLPEGLAEIEKLIEYDGPPTALKVEGIFAVGAGYLFSHRQLLMGPGGKRRELIEHYENVEDPVLKELTVKLNQQVFSMSLTERFAAARIISHLQ